MFQSWISGDHVFLDRCVHMQHRIHRKLVQSMSSRILWNELSRFESLFEEHNTSLHHQQGNFFFRCFFSLWVWHWSDCIDVQQHWRLQLQFKLSGF